MVVGPGVRIGPYEVTALIGEGGMGKVWRAHHALLKRDDALKVLPDAFADDADRLARFQREAQVLASLNHPNIYEHDFRIMVARPYGNSKNDDVAPDGRRIIALIPPETKEHHVIFLRNFADELRRRVPGGR